MERELALDVKKWLRNNKKLATVAGCVIALAAFSFVAIVVIGGEDALETIGLAPSPLDDDSPANVNNDPDGGAEKPELPLEETLAFNLDKAATEEDKLAVLEEYAENPDAEWSSTTLGSLILHGSPKSVRLEAFRIARELAIEDGHEAIVAVHKNGLRSTNEDVKQQAIIGCRDKPKYELLGELLKVVDRDSTNRHLAVQALAFMDAPEAQRKVLESAKSEKISKAERVQAILLLSRTNLSEAIGYLQELTIAEDAQYRKFALESLDAIQERRSKSK